ncbi:MAG: HDIG domain-containing protein, partial [Muribaculaceae bacterium]|nr:HDIG domain-containing protein [Muribaculaceae bacterium]
MIRKYLTRYNLSRAALFGAVIAIVVYLLPHTDSVKLSYDAGRPWIHPLLTAPFDIPVYRDSISTRALIDSIDATYAPVYKITNAPRDTLIARIRATRQLSAAQTENLVSAIDSIYRRGIVDHETADDIHRRSQISFIRSNVITRRDASGIITQRQAYAWIDSIVRDPASRHALQQLQLSKLLTPNLSLDTVHNNRLYNELLQPVTAAISVIQQGERIIDRGDIVTPQLDTILSTYESMLAERSSFTSSQELYILLGQILMAIIVMSLVYIYIYTCRRDIFDSIRPLSAIMTLLVSFYILAVLSLGTLPMGIFLVPFAILAILMMVFFDTTTAIFLYLIEILTCACITAYPLEFLFIEISVGMATIFTMHELSRRSQLLRTALIVFIVYLLSYLAIELMATATINTFSWTIVGYFAINMVLITFAYILIFIFEKLFGLISSVTLVELSDVNNPLLRKLSEQCPGTFQHSMSVSNLASNAAARIGANVQLVRAGALYHDIGKTNNPAFFTENQYGVNPHDALSPEQSARVLHAHITDGMRMATKAKLPRVVCDLIAQHHGAGKAKYFYTKYCNQHPGEVIDDALFAYPGPNPQTREASLLMMADSVEAASRSMTDHSPEAITRLVNNIIDSQVDDGLHRESPLSFRDIQLAKEAFIARLRTMYHSRIAYPKA